ncbi:MAG TPA: MFS transporter [Ktedonobacterales bacterium]|nr:MFS transporter [Ktedonobacterales bacterium]
MRRSLIFAFILGFVGFVTSFGAHIVAVNLPVYAKSIGIGVAMIGFLIAAYDLAELAAKPMFGALADRQGMKRTMLIGIAIFIVASLAYLVVDPRLLIVVRFFQGVGAAALSAVSLALIGVYYSEKRGRAYGIYNAIKGSGYVVSPLVGSAILLNSHFATIFVAAALVGALAFILSLTLPTPDQQAGALDDDDDAFSLAAFIAPFKEPRLVPWYAVTVVNMFFVGILFGFLPVRIYAGGYPLAVTGILLSAVAASYLLIQPLAGYLADTISPAATIRAGLLLAGVSIVVIPFVSGIWLGVVAVVAGIGVGTVWTNTDTLISTLARDGKLGATMGAAGSFKEFGDMIGPILIGLMSQAFGLPVGFVVCGALGLLSVLLISRKTLGLIPQSE